MSSTSKLGQLLRAAISFAVVIGAYCAYSVLAVPLIEPAAAEREGPDAPFQPAPPPTSRHAQLLARLYPDPQAWQRQRPKIIETDQAILLLKDYNTLVDGRMELKPCSLLFLPDQSQPTDMHDPRVVVLDAPEGAILQFDTPLDLRKAEFGRLIGGRLVGEVTFRSHGGENPEDQLFLTTRNVNMDERRIWTPHEVHFRYGRNYGDGRDLIITLLPAAEATGKQRGPNVGGIKSLELVRLERLHLVGRASIFPSKESLARSVSEESTLARGASEGPANADPSLALRARVGGQASRDAQETPIEVTCQGPFLFDLEESIATFEDQVNVLRLNPDGPSDQLNCRLLEIHFTQSLLNRNDDEKQAKPPAAAVRKVVALGHPVVLQSPSMGAQARGDRLEYDLVEKQFLLDGDQPVMLQHEGRRIEARAVQYQLPDSGRIGTAWAKGPGQFRAEFAVEQVSGPARENVAPPRVLTAVWQGELNLRPDGAQHVLSLTGGATVGESTFGGLAAGMIHLWLSEQSPSPEAASAEKMPNILPDRLLAENNVELSSPALSGETDRFEVWFHHIPQQAIAEGSGIRKSSPEAPASMSKTLASSATGSRYHVSGKLLRVLLAVAGKNTQLRDVSVEGNAQITESQVADPAAVPLRIAGEMIHVTAADSEQSKAVIVGRPAVVSGRGVAIEGASVHLDRAANRAWVPGPGQATLPMSRAETPERGAETTERTSFSPLSAPRSSLSATPESAVVTWRDGMQFDGRVVQLRGDVLARTETKRLAAPALDVALTRRIDFAQPPQRSRIEVQSVQFHGQVTAESRTLAEGKLVAVDQMLVRQLHIDNQSGELTADGPGWLKTVRHGIPSQSATLARSASEGGAAALPSFARRATAGGAGANEDNKLTYLRVTFQTNVTGNIHQRFAQLHEDVRAVYGKVDRWDETIDPDDALASRDDVVVLTSDMLQVAEMGKQADGRPAIELQALGNALVEGSSFTARAYRIAYAQAKDMLLMEGDGRSNAELYRQTRGGGSSGRAAARKIVYWLSTGKMDVDTFHSFDTLAPFLPGESLLPAGIGQRMHSERESRQVPHTTAPR